MHATPIRLPLALGACLALGLALGLPRAQAQETGGDAEIRDLAELVVTQTDPRFAWNDAARLAEFDERAVTIAIDATRLPDATPLGRIAIARVLLELGEHGQAARILMDVAASTAPVALRVEAVDLLGETGEDRHEDRLYEVLDEALDARLRASIAKALWVLTKDIDAKQRLRDLLRSDDLDLRVEGALALGEIRDFSEEVRAILERVRYEPTYRGRLADALLEKDDMERMAVASVPRPTATTGGDEIAGPARVVQETLERLREAFVEPGKLADEAALWEGAARGLVEAVGDPYTTYQSTDDREQWNDNLQKEYGGIGAYVGFNQDDIFTITRPMFQGPAWNAGLRPGTMILEVDGVATTGKDLTDIVKILRGPPGEPVKLSIYRRGWEKPRDKEIVRGLIQVPSVYHDLLPGDVGYVLVETFGSRTADEFVEALEDLRKRGATSLVLDLRSNTGGYLNTAQRMADTLLPKGKLVVETKGRPGAGPGDAYVTEGRSTRWSRETPLVVLTDNASASASEILSGALKLHGRARIVGLRTFGKGSVQNVFPVCVEPFCEPWTDRDGNGMRDTDEPYRDNNGNGAYDEGEPFYDRNGDKVWTPAEPYVDRNGNGHFDAPAVKVTIAKYYVSHNRGEFEFNPHRQEMLVAGERVWLGGLEPHVPVAGAELEGWESEEIARLEDEGRFDAYLDEHYVANKERFLELAQQDTRNPRADYPHFAQFYASLETKLSEQSVWRWLHAKLRNHASNDLGRLLVGDYVADPQLQRAILELQDSGEDTARSPAYDFLRELEFDVPPTYGEALEKARPVNR